MNCAVMKITRLVEGVVNLLRKFSLGCYEVTIKFHLSFLSASL